MRKHAAETKGNPMVSETEAAWPLRRNRDVFARPSVVYETFTRGEGKDLAIGGVEGPGPAQRRARPRGRFRQPARSYVPPAE